MRNRIVSPAICCMAAFGLLVSISLAAKAETIVALTENKGLVIFDSAKPFELLSQVTITGAGDDTIAGIDFRPLTGELYGLGHGPVPGWRLYIINPATGLATLRATLTADPTDTTNPYSDLIGTDFGVDFNPVVDRLRVVSNVGQNLRIHPTTGAVTTDTMLVFAAGDTNAGQNPKVVDVAYSNNVAGATSTSLFGLEGIDPDLHCQNTQSDGTTVRALCLVRQGGADGSPPSPNSGQLFTLAPFGKEGVKAKGFDISPSGTPFVAVQLKDGALVQFVLVSINLATGVDASMGSIGDGKTPLKDIAVAPSVQFSSDLYAVHEDAGTATITVTRTDDGTRSVTVDYTTSDGTAIAGQDYLTTMGTLMFAPGDFSETFSIPIINDANGEGDEFIRLNLSNPSSGEVLGGPRTALLRINANDRVDRSGPILLRVGLTGPSRGITGAVLHFNEDLDPTSSEDLNNYEISASGGGRKQRFELSSAVYDPVRRTVQLVVAQPFGQTQFKHVRIEVNGKRGGVTDLSGNLLDGDQNGRPGGNAVFVFEVFSGLTVTYEEADGDRATLFLTGGGRLDGIVPIRAPDTQFTQFWILDPIALKTSISGTVTTSRTGNGIVIISEIIGLDKKEFTPLITNPSFRVNTLTFSSNATGR